MSAQTAIAEAPLAEAPLRRTRRTVQFNSALLVSGAMAASGVLTYAFQILAARRLDAGQFGRIAVLWGGVFLLAIVLFRPLEQTLSRAIAHRLANGEEIRSVLRSVALVAIVVFCLIVAASLGTWSVVTNRLFEGDGYMTAMLLAGTCFYGLQYIVRGLLGGVRWFQGYSAVLLADAAGRIAVALPLLAVASPHLAASAVAAAGLLGALAPFVWARRWLPALRTDGAGEPFDSRSGLRFAGPAAVVAASDQLLINGGPLLVVLLGTGGTKAAGVVFAATMLVRAPVYVFTGVAASLLPNFTLLAEASRAELARVFGRTLRILSVAGVVIVVGVAAVGPTAMDILYGGSFEATRLDLVLLAASVSLYLASATLLQALLAFDTAAAGAWAWLTSAGVLVGAYLLASGAELQRVSISLVAATAANALLHGGLLARLLRSRPA